MSKFNFTLKYISETKIEKVKKLNKKLDWKIRVENDNKNQRLIIIKRIWELVGVIIEGLEVDIIEKIKIARENDNKIVRVINKIKKTRIKILKYKE